SLSYAFDNPLAEDAVRANHQGEDHQDVGGEVFGAAAHVRIDIAGGDVLDDADDEPAHDRTRDGVQPAQDHDREHLEPHQRQVHVDAEQVSPQHAAQRRDDAGHGPRHAEVPLDVDAHGHGHLLVVGHRPHGD